VLIFAAVFIGFLSTLDGQFLNWDDDINFLGNQDFRGLGWAQLRWMWTETLMGTHPAHLDVSRAQLHAQWNESWATTWATCSFTR
jgi:hypothetical protein